VATLAQVMDEIANQIRTALESSDVAVQVEPRGFLAPTPPCIDMYPGDPSDDQTDAAFGDTYGADIITIRARVSTADLYAGEDLLLALMDDEDPLSISATLEADPTLNGLAQSSHLRARTGYRDFRDLDGEGSLLGCLWQFVVIKARS
jgi:hypothetical protein